MKTSRNFRASTAVALFFVLVVAQVCAVAASPKLTGKLKTRNNKIVQVNGNRASSGTTIFSGARIQSPEGVGATVDLGGLGRLDLAPQTNLTVNFSDGQVAVMLHSGYALLTTNKGVNGTIEAEGRVAKTDASKVSSVVARTAGSVGPETAGVAVGAGAAGVGKAAVLGIVGAGAAAGGAKAIAGGGDGRGQAVSPSTPR